MSENKQIHEYILDFVSCLTNHGASLNYNLVNKKIKGILACMICVLVIIFFSVYLAKCSDVQNIKILSAATRSNCRPSVVKDQGGTTVNSARFCGCAGSKLALILKTKRN